MGCAVDHSLVAFSTSRWDTQCVFLVKEALHILFKKCNPSTLLGKQVSLTKIM